MRLSNKLFIIGAMSLLFASCNNGSKETKDESKETTDSIETTKPKEYTSEQVIELKAKAEAGDAEAQYELGWCYENGYGVERNYVEAVKWFTKAAIQGVAMAQYNLGYCFENGYGVTKDKATAITYYRKAAKQDLEDAQIALKLLGF